MREVVTALLDLPCFRLAVSTYLAYLSRHMRIFWSALSINRYICTTCGVLPQLQWWQLFVGQAQQETRATAVRLAAALGADLGKAAEAGAAGGAPLSADDVLWGMAMAMSRKFFVEGQVCALSAVLWF